MTVLLAVICFFFIIFSIAEAIHGEEAPVWKAFSRIAVGPVMLYAAHVVSPLTGIDAPVSLFSAGVSAVLGIPGTALFLLVNTFFL